MKVLMVGCGAVGQVFGLYLEKAGVELGFYARPGTADRLDQALKDGGLPLFQTSHTHKNDPTPHRLANYQVLRSTAESQQFQPDQVWFTTPSPVFYSSWFAEFLQQVPSKRVVCFAPEAGRSEFYPAGVAVDRFVFGGITFISWQGDLDGGGGKPDAVNYWLPPLSQVPLIGEKQACLEVAAILKKGGLNVALKKKSFQAMQAAVTALMSAFIVGYELAGWSLRAYRRSPWLKLAARAAREAALSQVSGVGIATTTLFRIATTPAVFHIAALILPLLTPFDLENYLKVHYLKTREQTLTLLDVFIRDGERLGLAVNNIRLLQQGLQGLEGEFL